MARFAVTGVAAYGVDVAVFNMAVLAGIPSLAAKALSSAVALTVAYLGNRYVTWSHGPRRGTGRTVSSFLVISAAAALVQLCFLWASRHVLGLTSVLADNIAANVVGMAAATCLRFWGFRRFVFVGLPAGSPAPSAGDGGRVDVGDADRDVASRVTAISGRP
jgi:putative flippase GtrA